MQSVWEGSVDPPVFPSVEKDLQTDVAIIGGGMAGILCAAALGKRGIDCAVLESDRIGRGITARTTAVLSLQNELLFTDLVKKHGKAKTALYLSASLQAIENFAALAQNIDCDLEIKDAFTYSLHDPEKLKQETLLLRSLGFSAEYCKKVPLPFPVEGAVKYPSMAQFHPLKLLFRLAESMQIYEQSKAIRLEGTDVITERARVRAKKVTIATHFPFIDRYGWYFLKMYQKQSFVIALKNAPQLGCTIMDGSENGIYMRNCDDLLLIGGGDHRTGKKGGGTAAVRDFAKKYFPEAQEAAFWSNRDCVTLDGMPYIGRYRFGTEDFFVATGFDGWGMTGSMIASELLADMITGKGNRYAPVFDPHRKMPFLPLLQNGFNSLLGLLTPTVPRCSHMGCALKWNAEEGCWDCPCHGSSFDKHGNVQNNPANKAIKAKR